MTRFIAMFALVCSCSLVSAADFPDISHADLVAAIQAKTVTILDVNGTDSFTSGHIPGAIDYEANTKDLASKLPADKSTLIVAYCGGPKCGAWKYGAKAAAALGYTNIKHYSAGIKGWKASAEGQVSVKADEAAGKKACCGAAPCGSCKT